jgi:hypothetical protein
LDAPKEIKISLEKASQYTKDPSSVYLATSLLKEKEKLEFAVEKLKTNRNTVWVRL